MMSLKNKLGLISLLLLLLASANSWAAGLGGIDLDSYLNQPLKARIQLLGVPVDQVNTVSARLASAGDYRVMGLDQSRLSIPLVFTVKVWRGKPVIEVTSSALVRDPILQFAVDVSWQRGHLLREYTLFLDPPTVSVAPPRKKAAVKPVEKATPSGSTTLTSEDVNQAVSSENSSQTTAGSRQTRVSSMQAGEYGPVQSGETLWKIANNWREQGSGTVNQAMVAIVRLNPQDFVNGDINRLNQGAILRLPTAEDIANISIREANEIVSTQVSAWREQSTQIASPPKLSEQAIESAIVPAIKPVNDAVDDRAEEAVEITDNALARITDDRLEGLTEASADTTSDSTTETSDAGGLLELVPPAEEELAETEEKLPGSASGNDFLADSSNLINLESRLSVTEEELLAAQHQNAQLEDQVSSMQSEITALREGLNLNDSELAAMQQQMAVDLNADSPKPQQSGTRMLAENDKSLLERWWWLILLLLAGGIGFFVYRNRHNASVESQVEANFLDAIVDKKESAEFKGSDQAQEETLAADAEKILAVLEQGDAEIEQQFTQVARNEADAGDDEVNSEEAEAEEVRKFLDQVEADKAALASSSDDALDHVEATPRDTAVIDELAGSAEEEILDSLDSDDDSDSEQVTDNHADDNIEVKLDLARAYLAMEDKPAAQAILDEVMTLGSEQQQLEARSMLDEIE